MAITFQGIYSKNSAPPLLDVIWRDTSVTPNVLRIYNGVSGLWVSVASIGTVSAANNGLSVTSGTVTLGQTVGAGGAPGKLLSHREIPFNAFNLYFSGSTGNIGIGQTSASARLHIAAGTATAGSAPIKLTSGTNLTTPEAGAFEFDGTHLYFTIGSTRYQLDQLTTGLTANNGLVLSSGILSLGQTVGASGNPAQMLVNREIPMNGKTLTFLQMDTSSVVFKDVNSGRYSGTITISNEEIYMQDNTNQISTRLSSQGYSSLQMTDNFGNSPSIEMYTTPYYGRYKIQPSTTTVGTEVVANPGLHFNVRRATPLVGTTAESVGIWFIPRTSTSTFHNIILTDYIYNGATSIPYYPNTGATVQLAQYGQGSTYSGSTVTGSTLSSVATNVLEVLALTWNTTASPTLIKGNIVTLNAAGSNSKLIDLQVAGTSKLIMYVNTGNMLVGGTSDNSNKLQVTGNHYVSGNVGIGQSSTTARLHIAAGTATTNTAPIKLTTGVNLTTPEDGALEYSSSHLYFTIGSTRYQIDQQNGIGGPVVGGTAGSVLFVDSSGNLGQNNTKFFWDNTNNYLGLGTVSPSAPLHVNQLVFGSAASTTALIAPVWNTSGNPTAFKVNPQVIGTGVDSLLMDIQYSGTSRMIVKQDGTVGIGTTTPVNAQLYVNDVIYARNVGDGDLSGYVFGLEYIWAFHKKMYDQGTPTIVLCGDSTTQGSTSDANYSPGNLIQQLMLENYMTSGTIFNDGVSGSDTDQWVSSYLPASIARNPDLMIIRYGINDGASNRAGFESDLRAGLALIRASRSLSQTAIILMTPNSTNDTPNGRDETWDLIINPIIRKAARDYNCVFIDTYTYFRDSVNAGAWMDNPYGDGRHIHPEYLMNLWIFNLVGKVMFPQGFKRLIGTTNIENPSSGYRNPLSSDAPSTYLKGISLHRATTGNGWVNDGQVITFHQQDGVWFQINNSYTSTGFSFRNGGSGTWQAWQHPFTNGETFLGVGATAVPSYDSTASAYFRNTGSGIGVHVEGNGYSRICLRDSSEATDKKMYEILNDGQTFSISRTNDALNSRTQYLTIYDGGNIGIFGSFSATAKLHLPAGTATAGTAPLKLTTGTNLTTAEDGAFEYNGTNLYFTIGSTRYILNQSTGSLTFASGIVKTTIGSTSTVTLGLTQFATNTPMITGTREIVTQNSAQGLAFREQNTSSTFTVIKPGGISITGAVGELSQSRISFSYDDNPFTMNFGYFSSYDGPWMSGSKAIYCEVPIIARLQVTAKTTGPVTLHNYDTGVHFTNEGASGSITFNLPEADGSIDGVHYYFKVIAAQTISIKPFGTDTIDVQGSVSTASTGTVSSNTAYNLIHIVCTGTGTWRTVEAPNGTWTVT